MVSTILHKCFVIFLILKCCESAPKPDSEEHIVELYRLLQKTVNDSHNDTNIHSLRRVFIDESEYQIHINKLKDVNGFKMHNIIIKHPKTDSMIYIINPLESKLPHPFMTLEEFKNALVKQQVKKREAFEKSKLKDENILRSAKSKTTAKFDLTRPEKFPNPIRNVTIPTKMTIKAGIARSKSIKERTKKQKVQNGFKTVTTKVMPLTTKTKQTTPKSLKTVEKKVKVNNTSSSSVDVKQKNTYTTVESSKASLRVKLVESEQTAPTKNETDKHKPQVKNEKLSNEILNLQEQSVNEQNVSSETSETRVNAYTIDTTEIALAINATDNKVSEIENKTIYLEKSENMPDTISTIVVEQQSAERKSTIYREEVSSTVDDKESINILGRLPKIEEESESSEAFVTGGGDKSTSIDDEGITVFEETTSESTTTTSTTTIPTTTTVTVKWSRPRVFMAPLDTGSTTPEP